MKPESIAQVIVQKGIGNVNLSMFSEDDKKAILACVAEIYIRQGKANEVMDILEYVDVTKFMERIKKMAEQCFQLGQYDQAAKLYEKLGDTAFAKYIKDNFLKS
jgi:hypothetical protein